MIIVANATDKSDIDRDDDDDYLTDETAWGATTIVPVVPRRSTTWSVSMPAVTIISYPIEVDGAGSRRSH
jgi:hypothetical protein